MADNVSGVRQANRAKRVLAHEAHEAHKPHPAGCNERQSWRINANWTSPVLGMLFHLPTNNANTMTNWQQASIEPDDAAIQALRDAWHWMLGSDWEPIVFSAIGDVFFSVAAGSVWWLSTATASLEQVADSREHFSALLQSERTDEWFLPGLPRALRENGKPLAPGQCYTYVVFPVFEHGSFSVENMMAMAAAAHFAASGCLHESIRCLPDGAEAVIAVAEKLD